MDFTLSDIRKKTLTYDESAELKKLIGDDMHLMPYSSVNSVRFIIKRNNDDTRNSMDLSIYARLIARYINSRNEIYVLDFIPNSEQEAGVHVVTEVGDTCLVDRIRSSMNGIVCKQIKKHEYELHAVNKTLEPMAIMSSHITLKGHEEKTWHGNFAPTVIIGDLQPGAELHISSIYMKPGRVFTSETISFENNKMIIPYEGTFHMHNGLTHWSYDIPENPMVQMPSAITLGIPNQPYADAFGIFIRSLEQLIADLSKMSDYVKKCTDSSNTNKHSYGNIHLQINGNDLTCHLNGYDECIGTCIAYTAKSIEPNATHYTAHKVHPTKKEIIIRLTCANVWDAFNQSISVMIARTESIYKTARDH